MPDQPYTHEQPPGQKYYFDLLPAHPPPEPLESLTSYLLRLAQANQIKTFSALAALCFPYKRSDYTSRMADMPLDQPELASLARSTNCPPERLTETTFYHVSRKLGRVISPRAMPMFLSGAIGENLRYCPECLEEHLYYRLTWRFLMLTGCVTHSCELLDTCTHCGQQVPLFPVTLAVGLCPSCNKDLRACRAQPIAKKEQVLAFICNSDLEFLLSAQPLEKDPWTVAREVGSTYSKIRQDKGLTTEQVAQAMGVTVDRIQTLERGNMRIPGSPFTRYCSYADLLGVTFQDILSKNDKPDTQ